MSTMSLELVLCALVGLTGATRLGAQPADLVLLNARIWSDGQQGLAASAAIRDGRFIHVGDPDASLIGPETRQLDAGGHVVIPGLIDSHVHLLSGGRMLSLLSLREATSREDFVQRVADWVAKLEPGAWVLGGRWSTESWADPAQPTRAWLDPVTGDHPAYLPRMDGHQALVNSRALELAGITREGPPDPPGGVIDRDPVSGQPTGILRESAMRLVADLVPEPSVDDKYQALVAAMREANRHGLTAVADIPELDDLAAYQRLAGGPTPLRVFLYVSADNWAVAAGVARTFASLDGFVELRGLKAYMDGSLGSRTAFMREPYADNPPDRPQWRGLLREGIDGGALENRLHTAREAGLQPIVHAIGDEANHRLLSALEDVYGRQLAAARARVEHAQHLLPEDIARFASLGVIASMQPFHKADDARYAETAIGRQRAQYSYAFRSLLEAGAIVCFGSDWPVVTIDPWQGIDVAVTARTLDGSVWQPQERISVEQALRCYTSLAAYALGQERELGRIAPGYRADFVMLDRSPFDPDVTPGSIRPVAVYVEGRRVYPEP